MYTQNNQQAQQGQQFAVNDRHQKYFNNYHINNKSNGQQVYQQSNNYHDISENRMTSRKGKGGSNKRPGKGGRKGKGKGNHHDPRNGSGSKSSILSQRFDNNYLMQSPNVMTSNGNHPNEGEDNNRGPSFANVSTEDLVRRLKSSRSRPERQRVLAELGGNIEHRKKLTAPAATVVVAAAGRDNGWRDSLRWLELMMSDGSLLDVFHFRLDLHFFSFLLNETCYSVNLLSPLLRFIQHVFIVPGSVLVRRDDNGKRHCSF